MLVALVIGTLKVESESSKYRKGGLEKGIPNHNPEIFK
jgi:hypothetical protein